MSQDKNLQTKIRKIFASSKARSNFVALLVLFTIYCAFSPSERLAWTGFKKDTEVSRTEEMISNGKKITVVTKEVSGKTLWDWLSLLIAPASLLAFGSWIQARQEEEKIQRENVAKKQAEDNQQEEALEAYLANISKLSMEDRLSFFVEKKSCGLLTEDEQFLFNAGMSIVRARTISILRRLSIEISEENEQACKIIIAKSGKRKGQVLLFLYESKFLKKQVEPEEVEALLDLRNADFRDIDVEGEDFSNADLRNGFFTNAKFSYSDLSNAILSDALFANANLTKTNLSNSDLRDALFFKANLTKADFRNASLRGALLDEANLTDADLSNVKHWTTTQLGSAKLCRTNLPKDCSLDSNRDCEKLREEFLKQVGFSAKEVRALISRINRLGA